MTTGRYKNETGSANIVVTRKAKKNEAIESIGQSRQKRPTEKNSERTTRKCARGY
jgi:hypothetical protein